MTATEHECGAARLARTRAVQSQRHAGHVVELRDAGGEFLDCTHYGFHRADCSVIAKLVQEVVEALLAELVLGGVAGFRDPIGVEK